MALVDRAYRDAGDFEAMQALISACWLERRPLVAWTVGDLEWWGINDPGEDPLDIVRLYLDGSELVGWFWLEPPGGMAAALGDHVWTGEEVAALVDEANLAVRSKL